MKLAQALEMPRRAIRGVIGSPGSALVAVISIAIGIAANTIVFSVVHALLLRPLPYVDAERLVIIWNRSPGLNIAEDWFSTAQYFDIKDGHTGFDQVAVAIGSNQNLTGPFEPERIGVLRVSSNLLPMLGARTMLGRLFLPEEDAPGSPAVAVLSHGTWTRRFGADPSVLGRGGIRLALGATERSVLAHVMARSLRIAAAGAALGLVAAAGLARLMHSLRFGVGGTDGLTFGVATLTLMATTAVATYVPARRAARTDPIESLRQE